MATAGNIQPSLKGWCLLSVALLSSLSSLLGREGTLSLISFIAILCRSLLLLRVDPCFLSFLSLLLLLILPPLPLPMPLPSLVAFQPLQ